MSPEGFYGDLPRLMLVADQFTDPRIETIVECIVAETALRWVQLRDHEARQALFRGRAGCLVDRLWTSRPDLLVSINSDVGLADNLGTGVHLGVHGSSIAEARQALGGEPYIGYSAHTLEQALRAAEEGADYVTFSPVFPTQSKPGHPGTGVDAVATVCERLAGVPVIALGGITPARIDACRDAGAHGVAVLSGILGARDPVAAAGQYLAKLTYE
jgi:thiamine-phosphate pyrophosphorylase